MQTLHDWLAARIEKEGGLSFAQFMEAALYHPDFGYYASGKAAIGRRGDYFTNVSVGPLFGRLLLRQFAEMWRSLGAPADFTIVEQGAHHGDLAADVLEAAKALEPEFFAALTYIIVEPLERNREPQTARLGSFAKQVSHVHDLAALPSFTGVHFSNELLDAFPVHVVERADDDWRECVIAHQDGAFVWSHRPIQADALRTRVDELPRDLPVGYRTEINLLIVPWVSAIASRLATGWVLAIDYGYPAREYYRPERQEGTLSAYAAHQRVRDSLQTPGEIDLTAHVDWTALARAAAKFGLQLAGFCDQHHWIVNLGRLHFHDAETITPELQKEHRAFKTLMHPNLLGAAFKAISFEKSPAGQLPRLSGFSSGDLRGSL